MRLQAGWRVASRVITTTIDDELPGRLEGPHSDRRGLNNGAVPRHPEVCFPGSSGNEVETAEGHLITFTLRRALYLSVAGFAARGEGGGGQERE